MVPFFYGLRILDVLNFFSDILSQIFQILHAFSYPCASCLIFLIVEFFKISFQRHDKILDFTKSVHN